MPAEQPDPPSPDDFPPEFQAALDRMSDRESMSMAWVSPALHFASCVTIKDRNNQPLENPVPNVLQRRMSKAYETLMEREVGKIRLIVVKPRQVGCSTFAQHIMYHFGQRRAVEGIVISDVKEHSEELLQKLKSYGHSDRFPWGRQMGGTKRTVTWEHGTNWTVDSAENPDAGVGGTRQAAHFSEVAKWPSTAIKNAERTMAAVLPSIGGSPSVVIAESTPEGAFGWFFDTYAAALRLEELVALLDAACAPEEVWVKVFAAWWEFAEHRRGKAVSEGEIERLKETLSPREEQGIERHGWDWEQIAWRRDTIDAKCNGSEKLFDCYYPEDDVSCWAASGAPRFEMSVLMDMDARARQAFSETGWLLAQETGGVAFSPQRDGKGELQVWERPREGMRYVIACDPATGESQTIGADPDRTSIQVWRARYFDTGLDRAIPARLVARVRAPFTGDDDVAAGHVARLSQWYGHALVALEVNQGLQVLRLLKDAGVPLYKRVVESARTRSREEQYGFKLTDDNQRRMVIEGLAAAIRNREVEVMCRDWIHEAMVFITKSNGRSEAAPGEHDDDIMAAAMAWEVLPSAGEFSMRRARASEPGDRGSGGWERV